MICHSKIGCPISKIMALAPNGMMEYWNTGMMGIGLRSLELKARRGLCTEGLIEKFVKRINFKMEIIL